MDNSDIFVDSDPKSFQHLINQLREKLLKIINHFESQLSKENISLKTILVKASPNLQNRFPIRCMGFPRNHPDTFGSWSCTCKKKFTASNPVDGEISKDQGTK